MKSKPNTSRKATKKSGRAEQPGLKSRLSDDEYLRFLTDLFSLGYTDEVRSHTASIQADPMAAMRFALFFKSLIDDNRILQTPQGDGRSFAGTADQGEAIALVIRCLDELEDFLVGLDEGTPLYILMDNHGRETTVEVGWQDPRAGMVSWDRCTVVVDDPVMAFAQAAFLFETSTYRYQPKPLEAAPPALYQYHPERFKAYRTYAEGAGKFYRQNVNPASGGLTLEQLNYLMRPATEELNRRSMLFPRKLKDSHPHPSLVMEAEYTLTAAYGRFVQAGRQIMDFPPALVAMLGDTDIDDIALDHINMPYAAQYLYFGPQAGLELEPGWLVDGAYVESRGVAGDMCFTVTAVPLDRSLSRDWYLFPEVVYSQDFVGEFRTMDLATAIDTVLAEKLHILHQSEAKRGGDITAVMEQHFDKEAVPFPQDLKLVDVSPTLATERLDSVARRHPVYRATLQLVVNALCYVTAYPDDMATVWPKATPVELVRLFLEGKGKEQQRAKSKLAALGYVPVHICGSHVAQVKALHVRVANQPGLHWRRGHWRNQAHGPARGLRKLIWVMPMMVGLKLGEEPERGHLYLVS